jgi:dihydroorotate dehydrogenase electron transfer subunit
VFNEKVKVLWNKHMGSSYYHMALICKNEFKHAKPGQFVMLAMAGQKTPLLRRPFSIHNLTVSNGCVEGIEILYKVVGESTNNLSRAEKNDAIHVLGPLGKGFTMPENARKIWIVAGGIGIAPMLFLASHLNLKGFDLSDSTLFIGGRNKADLLCRKTFADFGMKVNVATDDGSDGKKGLVIDLLDLTDKKKRPDVIFACGPYAMLKAVARLSEAHQILCQISIETIMACGMGACLGCAVETNDITDRYLHTCVDGPVFDSKIIKL